MIETFQGISHMLYFQGNVEPDKEYHDGDVVFKDGDSYVMFNNEWIPLGTGDASSPIGKDKEIKIVALKCKCCGASLVKKNGRLYCGYCDTEYDEQGMTIRRYG